MCGCRFASVRDAVLWFSLEGAPGVLQFRQSSLISVHFYTSSESVRGDLRMLDPSDAVRQLVMILIERRSLKNISIRYTPSDQGMLPILRSQYI